MLQNSVIWSVLGCLVATTSCGLLTKNAGGEVHGNVSALFHDPSGNEIIYLRDIPVYLQPLAGGVANPSSRVVSNTVGHFRMPTQPPGKYRVCSAVPNFNKGCTDEIVELTSGDVYLTSSLVLTPIVPTIHGKVTLTNGAPAATYTPSHTAIGAAAISIVNGSGKTVSGPVRANLSGQYLLANVPQQSGLKIKAEYDGTIKSSALAMGSAKVDLQIPGIPRDINSPSATDGEGGMTSVSANRHANKMSASIHSVSALQPALTSHPTFIDPALTMCPDEDPCTDIDQEANLYYQAIKVFDGNNQPTQNLGTLTAWKRTFQFSTDPVNHPRNELRAVYFNNGDLQLGRAMHCQEVSPSAATFNVQFACYVSNFSNTNQAGDNPNPALSILNAQDESQPIASVAMTMTTGDSPQIAFFAFDANGMATPKASLDSEGPKAVPGVCLACHGGRYSRPVHQVGTGPFSPSFLPFDIDAFIFGTSSADDQSDTFRRLNSLVNKTKPAEPIRALISGWYSWCGGVEANGCNADPVGHQFIPNGNCDSQTSPYPTCGWDQGAPGSASFYLNVAAKYCRSCHIARPSSLNIQSFNAFKAVAVHPASTLPSEICTDYAMPAAEVPFNGFWGATSPQTPRSLLLSLLSAIQSQSTACSR